MTEQPSYTCPICAATSYHPEDIARGYCERCHAFTGMCTAGGCERTPAKVFGNVAACASHARELDPPAPVYSRDLERQMQRVKTARHVVEIGLVLAMTGVVIWVAERAWFKALLFFVPWLVCFALYLRFRRVERSITGARSPAKRNRAPG